MSETGKSRVQPAFDGRDYSKTPVVVFRNGQQIIVTVGNFTDTDARLSVKKEQP